MDWLFKLDWIYSLNWIYIVDWTGTLIFAISGTLKAIDKKFDLFGASVIALVTSVGGGTIRDLLIGNTPVGWMRDNNYLIAILLALITSYLFKAQVLKLSKGMFLFDTIGIGLFTVLGVEKALSVGLSIPITLLMGVVSAVFGGVVRDVLCNDIPLIFRKEIYAVACLLGGIVYLSLRYFFDWQYVNMLSAMSIVIIIRYLSVRFKWSLNIAPVSDRKKIKE